VQPSEKKSHADRLEGVYKEFVEGVDRSLAPLRVVARLAALPQGAENCVDLWEVVDTVTHFVDVVEGLRDKLDLNIEIGGNPGGTAATGPAKKGSGGKKGSPDSTEREGGSEPPRPDGRN
jgi:hypothetical protein